MTQSQLQRIIFKLMTEQPTNSNVAVGQRVMALAWRCGICFAIAHMATIAVTCVVEGFGWGMNAWVLDLTGFLAGLFFAWQCFLSSRTCPEQFRTGNFWILVWASITLVFRFVDAAMLLGFLKWEEVYITPTGPTLWANIVSELVFGLVFTVLAFIGSWTLLSNSKDRSFEREANNSA